MFYCQERELFCVRQYAMLDHPLTKKLFALTSVCYMIYVNNIWFAISMLMYYSSIAICTCFCYIVLFLSYP